MARIYRRRSNGRSATNKNVLKRGQRKRVSRGAAAGAFYKKMMPCTAKYAASLIDPTSESTRGACIPQGFPMPSQKVRAFMRGVCSTGYMAGGAGYGFLMFIPSIANDATMIKATTGGDGTTTGNAISTSLFSDTARYPVNNVLMSKLPYTTAQLGADQIEGRLVSACIRVRYMGREDERSGAITLLETPDHEDILGQSYNQIQQYEAATTERPTGEGAWSQINWSGPAKSTEVNYTTLPTVSGGNAPMIIHLQAGTTTNQRRDYEYECWVNVEYVGRVAVGKTLVEVDPAGFAAVQQKVKAFAATSALNPANGRGIMQGISNIIDKAKSYMSSDSGKSLISTARTVASMLSSRGRKSTIPTYSSSTSGWRPNSATSSSKSFFDKFAGTNPYSLSH